jgi:hypothetical protein
MIYNKNLDFGAQDKFIEKLIENETKYFGLGTRNKTVLEIHEIQTQLKNVEARIKHNNKKKGFSTKASNMSLLNKFGSKNTSNRRLSPDTSRRGIETPQRSR